MCSHELRLANPKHRATRRNPVASKPNGAHQLMLHSHVDPPEVVETSLRVDVSQLLSGGVHGRGPPVGVRIQNHGIQDPCQLYYLPPDHPHTSRCVAVQYSTAQCSTAQHCVAPAPAAPPVTCSAPHAFDAAPMQAHDAMTALKRVILRDASSHPHDPYSKLFTGLKKREKKRQSRNAESRATPKRSLRNWRLQTVSGFGPRRVFAPGVGGTGPAGGPLGGEDGLAVADTIRHLLVLVHLARGKEGLRVQMVAGGDGTVRQYPLQQGRRVLVAVQLAHAAVCEVHLRGGGDARGGGDKRGVTRRDGGGTGG
eukprot:1177824-Prorocentrum_minimum.AAC.2